MRRAVFLDRDGVLTRSIVREGRPFAPTSLEEFGLLPGVVEALKGLKDRGFRLIVVTNQPDLADGILRPEVLDEMHSRLREGLPIDDIRVCSHKDHDQCACRKPRPGMLLEAARHWSIDLDRSFMVGDRWRDIAAGKAAGCTTIFVDHGYSERVRDKPDFVVATLLEASEIILSQ